MKIKTSDLIDAPLDYAVAKCKGRGIEFDDPRDPWLTRDGIADQAEALVMGYSCLLRRTQIAY